MSLLLPHLFLISPLFYIMSLSFSHTHILTLEETHFQKTPAELKCMEFEWPQIQQRTYAEKPKQNWGSIVVFFPALSNTYYPCHGQYLLPWVDKNTINVQPFIVLTRLLGNKLLFKRAISFTKDEEQNKEGKVSISLSTPYATHTTQLQSTVPYLTCASKKYTMITFYFIFLGY